MNKEHKTKYLLRQMNFAKSVAREMAEHLNTAEDHYIVEKIKKDTVNNPAGEVEAGVMLSHISDKITNNSINNNTVLSKISKQLEELQDGMLNQKWDSNEVKKAVTTTSKNAKSYMTLISVIIWLTVIIMGTILALQSFDLTIDIKNPDPEQTIEVKPS